MTQPKKQKQVIAPASVAQELFINSDADITIASGSAGSSKSYSILLRFLRYIRNPGTRGIIFRRTSTQLSLPSGLWEQAQLLYPLLDKGVRIKQKAMEIIFSSGAKLKFSYFENEAAKVKLKGLQADFIAFDEATEFSEEMVTYLLSRNRNSLVDHKPSLCMATNPDYDSFLRLWIDWWLDPNTGIPDPTKRGVKRYFVRNKGVFDWFDTREEAEAKYGKGEDNGVMSMCVIGSTCEDNPYIDKSYITSLKNLSSVECARLLYGSWYARNESAGYFKADWLKRVPHPNIKAIKRVRAYDLAATLPSEGYDPDWTAGVLMSVDKERTYTIENVLRFRDRFMGVEQRIIKQAKEDGRDVTILIPLDCGASSQSYAKSFQAKLAAEGFHVRLVKPSLGKVTRFAPFAAMAESGSISMVIDEWNNDYLTELEGFDGSKRKKDDQVDATSDAFNFLRQQKTHSFVAPVQFVKSNEFI